MAPRRKFDHSEARRLHRDGLNYAEIGRLFGVSEDAVRYSCDPEARKKRDAAALATTRRRRSAGAYRHHELAICPRCNGIMSRRSKLCRVCRERRTDAFGWLLSFAHEPDGSFSWWVRHERTGETIRSGCAETWDDARLAAVVELVPPSGE